MTYLKYNFFSLLFFTFYFCIGQAAINGKESAISITIDPMINDYRKIIEKELIKPFIVGAINFNADVYIQHDELRYLIGFKEGDIVDATVLTKALFYLIKKNVFERIILDITRLPDGSFNVTFTLTAFWTLGSVKIKGIWFGKDAYAQHYTIEKGEPFDIHKHYDSIEKIKEYIYSEGYLDAHVDDALTYESHDKCVNVRLTLERGQQFTISCVDLIVNTDSSCQSSDKALITKELSEVVSKRLTGKKYSKESVESQNNALKQMLLRRGFPHAEINMNLTFDRDNKTIKITFTLDLHVKKEFIFFGNIFFSHKQLLDVIMAFGKAAWMINPQLLAQEIESTYQNKGFWNISVETKEEEGRIFFIIHEGPRASIREVVLAGVTQFDIQTLINVHMKPIMDINYFDSGVMQNTIDSLINFYCDEGYFDAAIIHQERVLINENSAYRIILTIDEGSRRYIDAITFEPSSDMRLNCPYVQDIETGIKTPCTKAVIEKQRQWIEQQIARNQVGAIAKAELVDYKDHVTIIWRINDYMAHRSTGKTVLVGTRTAPFQVIMRELKHKEGDTICKNDLKESLDEVKALEMFDSVSIFPDQTNELGVERAILLKTEASDIFELQTRLGIGLQQMRWPIALDSLTYKVGGTFIFKNPTNSGDQFRIDIDATRAHRDVVCRYKRPWIFGFPIHGSIEGYSNKFSQQGFFYDRHNWYDVYQQGMLIGLHNKTGHIDSACTTGIEWMKLNLRPECRGCEDQIMKAFALSPDIVGQNIPYLFFEPTCIIDYLDQRIAPSRGSSTLMSCKCMLPLTYEGSCSPYIIKFLVEQSLYATWRKICFAARFRAGYIFAHDLEHIMLNERFYLGGARSLRSYYTDCTPPLGQFDDMSGNRHFVPRGGKAMVNANFEVRFPIMWGLQGVVFQDVGALSHSHKGEVEQKGILAGTGFGFLYNTPIGALRFDIGWKWSCQKPFDRSYAWYVTLGQIF